MRSPERRTSLRTRVAIAAALIAAIVGVVSAGIAALLVDELTMSAQDQRLRDAASLMEREIASEGGDPRRHVDDEAAEVAPVGLRLALFEDGARVAGALDVVWVEGDRCVSQSSGGESFRTCALGGRSRQIIVSTRIEGARSRRSALLLSVGAAGLIAAVAAALTSRKLAGWALAPLTALGERLEIIQETDDDVPDLGTPSNTAEVEALRETIRGLLGRLGEAMARSKGFASSAAHELRTPLATIMAELELAAEEAPHATPALERVRRTAARLSVLVERLLTSASGAAGAQLTEAVALEDVVRDVVAARSDEERARLSMSCEASGTVRGDETLLRLVVDNLVDNALKFARSGEVQVVVTETADDVQLTVRDEGAGVDLADQERLLLPFARGPARGDEVVAGHGLGLSIVAHVVRLHAGDVRFVARRDAASGAEVRVTIPGWAARAES